MELLSNSKKSQSRRCCVDRVQLYACSGRTSLAGVDQISEDGIIWLETKLLFPLQIFFLLFVKLFTLFLFFLQASHARRLTQTCLTAADDLSRSRLFSRPKWRWLLFCVAESRKCERIDSIDKQINNRTGVGGIIRVSGWRGNLWFLKWVFIFGWCALVYLWLLADMHILGASRACWLARSLARGFLLPPFSIIFGTAPGIFLYDRKFFYSRDVQPL